jgi:hypothetical protein
LEVDSEEADYGSGNDLYTKVWFDGKAWETSVFNDGHNHIWPNWKFEKEVDANDRLTYYVPMKIDIWDYDYIPFSDGEQIDIAETDGIKHLAFDAMLGTGQSVGGGIIPLGGGEYSSQGSERPTGWMRFRVDATPFAYECRLLASARWERDTWRYDYYFTNDGNSTFSTDYLKLYSDDPDYPVDYMDFGGKGLEPGGYKHKMFFSDSPVLGIAEVVWKDLGATVTYETNILQPPSGAPKSGVYSPDIRCSVTPLDSARYLYEYTLDNYSDSSYNIGSWSIAGQEVYVGDLAPGEEWTYSFTGGPPVERVSEVVYNDEWRTSSSEFVSVPEASTCAFLVPGVASVIGLGRSWSVSRRTQNPPVRGKKGVRLTYRAGGGVGKRSRQTTFGF